MDESLGQILSLAVAVTLSPVPLTGVVLMLATPRGRSNGIAFVLGWVFGLAVAGTILLLVGGGVGVDDGSASTESVSIVKLLLGLLLVRIAQQQWQSRPREGVPAALPTWLTKVDSFTPAKSAGLAVVLSAVNPKNLLLVVAAATAISQSGASSADQALALAVFVIVATIGPGVIVGSSLVLGEKSDRMLDSLRNWLTQNGWAIMAVICLLIAAKLIGDAVTGL